MQNRKDKKNGSQRSQSVHERKKKSREMEKRKLEETAKEEKKKEPALGRIPFSQRFFSL